MKNKDFAIAYLKAVEKKHKNYFDSARLNIIKCVEIKGESLVSVHVINDAIPTDIRYDIEEMFWRD
ncbi:MAG: hypothetical protein JWP94_2717 [Mucilaginibacter sp.]|jgi:hypothetical protein|nr:hypothetical protein [Mucilaginibacter sp.]